MNNLSKEQNNALCLLAKRKNYSGYVSQSFWFKQFQGRHIHERETYVCFICGESSEYFNHIEHGLNHLKEFKLTAFI